MLSQPSHKIVLGSRFEVEADLGDHPKPHLLAGDGSDTRRGCNAQSLPDVPYRSFAIDDASKIPIAAS